MVKITLTSMIILQFTHSVHFQKLECVVFYTAQTLIGSVFTQKSSVLNLTKLMQ